MYLTLTALVIALLQPAVPAIVTTFEPEQPTIVTTFEAEEPTIVTTFDEPELETVPLESENLTIVKTWTIKK